MTDEELLRCWKHIADGALVAACLADPKSDRSELDRNGEIWAARQRVAHLRGFGELPKPIWANPPIPKTKRSTIKRKRRAA
jgi:hypothetical protein